MQLSYEQVVADVAGTADCFRIAPGCAETSRSWADSFRCLPSIFLSLLSKDLPTECRVEFCLRVDNTGTCVIQLFRDGSRICTAEREFDLHARTIRHSGIQVLPIQQNLGIGKLLLRNSMRLYRKLGIHLITLSAGLDAGGYAWARFGFRPSNADWSTLKIGLRARMSLLHNQVSPDARKVLSAALDDDEGSAIWEVSDLSEPLGATRLGYHLLAGTNWNGHLDLRDDDAMERFLRYVGEQNAGGAP